MTKKEIKILDKLFYCAVKERDKFCQVCGKGKQNKTQKYLQAHHIFGRINRSVRWHKLNGILLCAGCHTLNNHSAHQDPEFVYFVKKRLGAKKYNVLKKLAKTTAKYQDYEQIKSYLKGENESQFINLLDTERMPEMP